MNIIVKKCEDKGADKLHDVMALGRLLVKDLNDAHVVRVESDARILEF